MAKKEEIEVLEEETPEEKPEKIEKIEHKESKYDDLKPRTEMANMSKKEKEEIKEKVLKEEDKFKFEEQTNNTESKDDKNKSNQLLNVGLIIIALIQIVVLFQFIDKKSDIDLYEDCGWEPDVSRNIRSRDDNIYNNIDDHSTSESITGDVD